MINIAGLAIGISASLVIYLIVHFEFSYDRFHPGRERIYRVVTNMHFPDQDFKNGGVPGPLPEAFRQEIPGIEKSVLFSMPYQVKVDIPAKGGADKVIREQKEIVFAEDGYFDFIHYKWLAGSPSGALSGPNRVVLTESRARTYFPFPDISSSVGQTIVYDDTLTAVVTGIVEDLPGVTDFHFQEFISLSTCLADLKRNNGWDEWGSVSSSTQFFVQLKKGTDPRKTEQLLATLRKKHAKDAYLRTDHFLQPLSDIHFNPEFDPVTQPRAHKPTLYGLLAVASFLLVLGCINFINLTTAQASRRAREIGIRKTMGGAKKQLVIQFLGETFILTFLAALLSFVLTPWFLKIFSGFIPEGLSFRSAQQPHVVFFILGLVLVVSLFSGFYPAMVLSGFKPVAVLKNTAFAGTAKTRRVWIRKTLTVSQFVIAQFFIIATMVVGKQIRYSVNKDMGFKKEAVIYFSVPGDKKHPGSSQFAMREKLKAIPGIEKISLAGSPPASSGSASSTMKFKKDDNEIETTVEVKQADSGYFDLYGITFLAGRKLQQSDTLREYVINNTYARFLGYNDPAQVIGETLERGDKKIPIVGVIKDIHFRSVHSAITPLVFGCQAASYNTFHIALSQDKGNTDNWKNTISRIEKAYKELFPERPFTYSFFDEKIAAFYKKEQDIAKLLNWSTGLTIFISCLGLLGLVIYTTTQRVKEIGVRKVLGASVLQIVTLLSHDFIRLVLIAFLIAVPVAWWAMTRWLEDYAYRTTLSAWIFIASGILMLLLAFLTLSIQTIRSAAANPVKSLRTE